MPFTGILGTVNSQPSNLELGVGAAGAPPDNTAPIANAGANQGVTAAAPHTFTLGGGATDDGLPDPPAALSSLWTLVSGPGGATATFVDDTDPGTDVELSDYGEYVLRLTVDDGELTDSDDVTITLTEPTAVRLTRAAARTLSGETSAGVAVTRVAVRTLSPMPSPVALTRLAARALSGMASAVLAVTRAVVRTLSRQLPPDPCATPPDGEDLRTAVGPLMFVEWDPGDGPRVFSEVGLDDDTDYYHGYKPPHLVSVSEVRRALSGPRGDYEVGTFTVKLGDPDRTLRGVLASSPGLYFPGREVAVYMISDAGRRAKAVPRLIAWGVVDGSPTLNADLTVELPCRDLVGGAVEDWGLDTQALIPRRVIAPPEFPEARKEVLELGVPFPYGVLSDGESQVGTAPTLAINTDKARGGSNAGGDWVNGAGDMGHLAPPATVTVSEVAANGGAMGADAHGTLTFYIGVTTIDADGHEGDPNPFVREDTNLTLAGADSTIHVEWDAVASAATYRVYLGAYWFGVGFLQYIETASLSCDFTKAPAFGVTPSASTITPGAHVLPWSGTAWFCVSAVMADGETEKSVYSVGGAMPPGRKSRLEWEAVADAVSYRVYRGALVTPQTPRYLWEVPSTSLWFDHDWSTSAAIDLTTLQPPHGAVQPIYVGEVFLDGVQWHELLVAGCAIDEITSWAYREGTGAIEWDQGAGSDFLVPGATGWPFPQTYRDIAGDDGVVRRRTVIYAAATVGWTPTTTAVTKGDKIASGAATFRINLSGIEDVGNGSGEVVTDLYQQAVHFFNHLLLTSYLTGDWSTPPMFPGTSICLVNCPSFTALTNQRKAELSGGYVGAWIAGASGERMTAQEWIGRLGRSGACRIGPNRFWQLMAWAVNPALVTSGLPTVVDIHDVDGPSGDPAANLQQLWNVIPYTYGPPLDSDPAWLGEATVRDAASVTAYRKESTADLLDLYCLRSGVVAAHAAGQHLLFSKVAPVYVEPEGDLRLSAYDHGSAFKYSHFRGLGASGYVDRVFVVVGMAMVPMSRRIRLEAVDVTPMLA